MTDAWDGRPQNPERDGWRGMDDCPSTGQVWTKGGMHLNPKIVDADGDWWRQRLKQGSTTSPTQWAPVLTPAEVTAREAASAEAMREACAASCMKPVANTIPRRWKSARDCVEGIYALPLPHASALARALAAAEKRGMDRAAKLLADWPVDDERITVEECIAIIRNAAAQESEG